MGIIWQNKSNKEGDGSHFLHSIDENNFFPFDAQQDRRHKTTTDRKSVKNWDVEYIGSVPTVLFILITNNKPITNSSEKNVR